MKLYRFTIQTMNNTETKLAPSGGKVKLSKGSSIVDGTKPAPLNTIAAMT